MRALFLCCGLRVTDFSLIVLVCYLIICVVRVRVGVAGCCVVWLLVAWVGCGYASVLLGLLVCLVYELFAGVLDLVVGMLLWIGCVAGVCWRLVVWGID